MVNLTGGAGAGAAVVPMAFQSALAGIMLAADLVKHAVGMPTAPPRPRGSICCDRWRRSWLIRGQRVLAAGAFARTATSSRHTGANTPLGGEPRPAELAASGKDNVTAIDIGPRSIRA